ncbi:SDR family NAD(P)-dependent oxidoreductase [Paenibacillus sepulcri]|uniref:SDR family NAD(P)-dependent oxidoreductase n=1 Tax=Paenibacillus sepulcri TaxID=359917 RepID=A0ABS7C3H0_9BACL|nr:SDR family NAD(P)-dependent oxidoreductase [Paenibacillus sepulcri]
MSRTQEKLDQYCEQLKEMGIEAAGFAADITNKNQLLQAFQRIHHTYGSIDVLEYSPHSGNMPVTSILDTTDESVIQAYNNLVLGAVNSARQVIPGMLERGSGALLFTTDLSAMNPSPIFGNVGIAMAGLRNYVLNLHDKLSPKGIYVGHLSISPLIRRGTNFDPDYVAEAWYNLYDQKTVNEETYPQGVMQHLN